MFSCRDADAFMNYSNLSVQYKYHAEKVPVVIPPEKRGIAMVVYEATMFSAYGNINLLRELGCELPIEIWYRAEEVDISDLVLVNLQRENPGSLQIREIVDPLATRFYAKMYAVYHSHFEQVLFMDADNTAARDPTYLFHSKQFRRTGAIFWPDYWQPSNTVFNINSDRTGTVYSHIITISN